MAKRKSPSRDTAIALANALQSATDGHRSLTRLVEFLDRLRAHGAFDLDRQTRAILLESVTNGARCALLHVTDVRDALRVEGRS